MFKLIKRIVLGLVFVIVLLYGVSFVSKKPIDVFGLWQINASSLFSPEENQNPEAKTINRSSININEGYKLNLLLSFNEQQNLVSCYGGVTDKRFMGIQVADDSIEGKLNTDITSFCENVYASGAIPSYESLSMLELTSEQYNQLIKGLNLEQSEFLVMPKGTKND